LVLVKQAMAVCFSDFGPFGGFDKPGFVPCEHRNLEKRKKKRFKPAFQKISLTVIFGVWLALF
jgi:hypothetical protein